MSLLPKESLLIKEIKDRVEEIKCFPHIKKLTYRDFLDWRKGLLNIPLFCEFTWKKISKERIRKHFNSLKEKEWKT